MNPNSSVFILPADKNPHGLFFLVAASSDRGFSFAKSDGSFTDKERSSLGMYEAVGFETAEDAICWAEASPRSWQVLNKHLVGQDKRRMPERLTVRVTEARYAPFLHEIVQQRRDEGEAITQITIKFEMLHWEPSSQEPPLIGGCHVLIDQEAVAILTALGLQSPIDLVDHMLVLQSDDPDDLFRPLQIWNVV
jgi:hypothetical protein